MTAPRKWKGADPMDRLGVYKRLVDVPAQHRFFQYTEEYAGRNVWSEFIQHERDAYGYGSKHWEQISATCEQHWKEHMAEQWSVETQETGRHPALARPIDVETLATSLLGRMKVETAYSEYWTRLEGFYDYLMWHPDHPHRYHPVLMAAAEHRNGASGEIWDRKINRYEGDS